MSNKLVSLLYRDALICHYTEDIINKFVAENTEYGSDIEIRECSYEQPYMCLHISGGVPDPSIINNEIFPDKCNLLVEGTDTFLPKVTTSLYHTTAGLHSCIDTGKMEYMDSITEAYIKHCINVAEVKIKFMQYLIKNV